MNSKYLSSAFLLVLTSVIVKVIGAVYKIPLTAFIGAVGRGYFAVAYNIYLPIHAIVLGAFPIALSSLVSKYNTNGNRAMLFGLRKATRKIFLVVGLIGMAVMLAFALPYSRLIADSPKSLYTILVLAPSALFSAMASSYQDYYKGLMNMKPTAVSQLIDAGFKMVFGLAFAKYSMAFMYNHYLAEGSLFGTVVADEAHALSLIYPVTSAFAMLGACLGSFASLVFVFVYDLINRERGVEFNKNDVRLAGSELLSLSFPIMISCAVQSVFQFLDTASLQYALSRVEPSSMQRFFSYANVGEEDLTTYAYGVFSTALDFKSLVIGITMSLGICAVPAISRELELGNSERLTSLINSVYKYTVLLALYGGVLLSLYSKEILSLFYGGSEDIVVGCSGLVKWFGLTIAFYSLAGTAVNVVQAIGCPERSIKAYVASGVIRVVLNLVLVKNESLVLFGAVISGAVGYAVMTIWNLIIVRRSADVRASLKTILIKPVPVMIITYYTSAFLSNYIGSISNQFINLLMKIIVSSLIFCILCFSLKLLKFERNFLHGKSKKTA